MQTQKKDKPKRLHTITYALKYPVEWGTETITELEFTRPKGKHLKHLGQNITLGDIMTIASKICGHPPKLLEEMDAHDYNKVAGIVSDFLDTGEKDGKND